MKDIYALGIHIGYDRCAALVKKRRIAGIFSARKNRPYKAF